MDFKANWPLYAGGVLVLVAIFVLLRGSQNGGSYTVGQTSTAGADQVATAYLSAQAQQQQSVGTALDQYLSYLANKDSLNASDYQAYIEAQAAEFQVAQSSILGSQYINTQQQEFQSAQPNWWQQLVAGISQLFGGGAAFSPIRIGNPFASALGNYLPQVQQ